MLQSSIFSIGPEFRKKGRKLCVRTSCVARRLTLGLVDRTMIVDPDKKIVRVRDRRFWFGQRVETYPFDLISAISFHLSSANHSGSWTARDSFEVYSIGLKLHLDATPDVHLFRFSGEGRYQNVGPLPNWVYWYQSLTDICGTHEEDAQRFVTALGWVLNKPIVPR